MNRAPERRWMTGRRMALAVVLAAAALGLLLGGAYLRQQPEQPLSSQYGRRLGREAARSVNGTFVLGELFRQRGWRVASFDRFSPALDRFDALVWVPDDFDPPPPRVQAFLEDWLASRPGRTVLYVGRDYDAAWRYWTRIAPQTPSHALPEVRRRRAQALAAWEQRRSTSPPYAITPWFMLHRDAAPQEATTLSGPWADGLDPRQAELYLASRLTPPAAGGAPAESVRQSRGYEAGRESWEYEVLLAAEDQPLVFRVTHPDWIDSKLLVVTNGSLVLNFPLAFPTNRVLAGRLIEACGPPDRVAFVESGPEGPKITSSTPPAARGWTLLAVWPLNLILLHLMALGFLAVLARAPLFGRPRELPAPPLADFGRHVEALGLLLARTRDRQYARQRLAQYRQTADRRKASV